MSSKKNIAVVLGTRPEIIKLAGVIRLLEANVEVIYTGQHSDDDLSSSFFESFRLPAPDLRLEGVGGASRGSQISSAMSQLNAHFVATPPRLVVVQGDTNATSAGAQAANYCDIPVLHVEAGLRSYDRSMPEEINRRVVSVLAAMNCAPTLKSADNLTDEGISPSRIRLTGNTVVEALQESLPPRSVSMKAVEDLGLKDDGFVLATIHRPENTDDEGRLAAILDELARIPLPVVFPVHPRTAIRTASFGMEGKLRKIVCCPPLDHPSFLALARHARVLVSDSGGIQEECTVLKKPLVVVRRNTERPEAIEAGFAVRVEAGPEIYNTVLRFIEDADLLHSLQSVPCPFGDGKASQRIAEIALSMASGEEPQFCDFGDYFSYSPK
ncbi:non-hydrolyzing UDP-N-acetylglucosamine 2-epimerase [Streptomyces sp. NPDC056254]|uniref:non-hydrolyzing UDP-N-acetylglucosamine 2-epimerase n=1 Tax=Streptomyces sp. NPDC056254 TaxID=3345763 RepID=UPI0035DEE87F